MKNIETYEDFLNMTVEEYHNFCLIKQPRDVVQKILKYYKRAKEDGKKQNTINESILKNKSITLKESFGIE